MNFAAESYGWSMDQILDCSLVFLLLLMNEHTWKMKGGKGISLSQMEELDKDLPWEEMVRRNRERLRKSAAVSIS
jgi:hypothetical protein